MAAITVAQRNQVFNEFGFRIVLWVQKPVVDVGELFRFVRGEQVVLRDDLACFPGGEQGSDRARRSALQCAVSTRTEWRRASISSVSRNAPVATGGNHALSVGQQLLGPRGRCLQRVQMRGFGGLLERRLVGRARPDCAALIR